MSTSRPELARPRLSHLPVRSLRVVGGHGEELVGTTVYCPLQEQSTAVAKCEECERFHALHFDAETRTTSVACRCESGSPASPEYGAQPARAGGPKDIDPNTALASIMTKAVVAVGPETSLDDVMELLVRHNISGVPVVDGAGRALGIVSRADVLRAGRERGDTEEMRAISARPRDRGHAGIEPGSHVYEAVPITAGEAMNPVVLALHESSNIGQAAALMAFEGVHRLPVVADRGEVVGILSAIDVLRWFGRLSGYLIPPTPGRG